MTALQRCHPVPSALPSPPLRHFFYYWFHHRRRALSSSLGVPKDKPATKTTTNPNHHASSRSLSSSSSSSHMQPHGYQQSSHQQHSAHSASYDLLEASVRRVSSSSSQQQQRWADLGSADGTNSLQTLRHCLNVLRRQQPDEDEEGNPDESNNHTTTCPPMRLHMTFSDHPDSDEALLQNTLQQHDESLFQPNHVTYDVKMGSFYNRLLDDDSMDLILSHVCLHWLNQDDDTTFGSVANWRHLANDDDELDDDDVHMHFTQIHERTCPLALREKWRTQLATPHLAQFFCQRALELKPSGGECFVVMVSHPHEFATPHFYNANASESSLLTQALQQCVEQGTVRAKVLRDTCIPYYWREPQDVRDAVELANRQLLLLLDADQPPPQLELVNVRKDWTRTGGDSSSPHQLAQLFWSIHAGSVRAAGLLGHEEAALVPVLEAKFAQTFDQRGVEGHFVACTVRRVQ